MLGTRYEEYISFDENLPFGFEKGIEITSTKYRSKANWHDNLELQFITDGSGYVLMDSEKHFFFNGQIAAINSNVIHHTNTPGIIVYDCLIIDTAFCRQIGIDTALLHFEPCIDSQRLRGLHKELISVYDDYDNGLRIAQLNKIIIEILIELRKNHITEKTVIVSNKKVFEKIRSVIKYIRENYQKKLTLDELAKITYMNKYSLSREFKKATNDTVIHYLNSFRCKKAADLISEGMSVSDAARECGFTNMSFFTKTFKNYMGCMPSRYS